MSAGPTRFQVPFDPAAVEASARQLAQRVREGARKGRHLKVRVKLQGRAVLPELPIGVFLAGQALGLALTGPLAALALGLGAAVVLDVELFDERIERLEAARRAWVRGDVPAAEAGFRAVLKLENDDVEANLGLAGLQRALGRLDLARGHAARALAAAPAGPLAEEAAVMVAALAAGPRSL